MDRYWRRNVDGAIVEDHGELAGALSRSEEVKLLNMKEAKIAELEKENKKLKNSYDRILRMSLDSRTVTTAYAMCAEKEG